MKKYPCTEESRTGQIRGCENRPRPPRAVNQQTGDAPSFVAGVSRAFRDGGAAGIVLVGSPCRPRRTDQSC